MQVQIRIKRLTEYCSIVEMSQEVFDNLQRELDGDRVERYKAEKDLNRRISVSADWQDDEFYSLEEFEPLKD